MKSAPRTATYDMGYTETEFEKVLKGEFTDNRSQFTCNDTGPRQWTITWPEESLSVAITIRQQAPRVLGAMSLPVLQVRFEVQSGSDRQSDYFFTQFFKYFHKGGG